MSENESKVRRFKLSDLKFESKAEEIAATTDPVYGKFCVDLARRERPSKAAIAELAALPLERRYTWRVMSALKWAFADWDSYLVELDCKVLSKEDLNRLLESFGVRPYQFCSLVCALVGKENMKRLMVEAIQFVGREPSESGARTVMLDFRVWEEIQGELAKDLPRGRPERMWELRDPEFHRELKEAEIIVGQDENTGKQCLVFGRSTLEAIIASEAGDYLHHHGGQTSLNAVDLIPRELGLSIYAH